MDVLSDYWLDFGHNQFTQIVQLQLTMVTMVSQFERAKQNMGKILRLIK